LSGAISRCDFHSSQCITAFALPHWYYGANIMRNERRSGWLVAFYLLFSWCAGIGACALTGCERKEKVIDVETPGADIEVERNIDTGAVDVEVENP
jgi:hypothetical protein